MDDRLPPEVERVLQPVDQTLQELIGIYKFQMEHQQQVIQRMKQELSQRQEKQSFLQQSHHGRPSVVSHLERVRQSGRQSVELMEYPFESAHMERQPLRSQLQRQSLRSQIHRQQMETPSKSVARSLPNRTPFDSQRRTPIDNVRQLQVPVRSATPQTVHTLQQRTPQSRAARALTPKKVYSEIVTRERWHPYPFM